MSQNGLSLREQQNTTYIKEIKANIKAISSDTHQLHATPVHHYNIIIIFDTVVRQKIYFQHEKELIEQCRHLATLACCLANIPGMRRW